MLWLGLLLPALAVDRSKFRTCEQDSFCRRYRKWVELQSVPTPRPTHWYAVTDVAQTTFDLQNANEETATLVGHIDFYACGAIRFRVNEKNPLHPRYVIPDGDVIVNAPTVNPKSAALSNGGASFQWQSADKSAQFRLDITANPFKIELYVNGTLSQTINSNGLFNFEVYRKQTQKDKVIDAANHPTVQENGLWEESFSGFTDKKPFGPAALGVDVVFNEASNGLYGLPEHATGLKLKNYDEPYRFYNLDVFEYELDEPMALYGAVPIVWAPGPKSTTAFLWVNPSDTFVKVQPQDGPEAGTWWTSESSVMDMILFPGPTAHAVSSQFHVMTGPPQLPPLSSIGMHQCRWNYKDERDTLEVDAKYEEYDIPYDMIWLDIEHTDGKRYFTWDSRHFPTPRDMRNKLAHHQRQLVTIVDPHIKTDSSYSVYTTIQNADLFCKKRDWEMIDHPDAKKPDDYPEMVDDMNAEVAEGQERPKIPNPEQWRPKKILNLNSKVSQYDGYCWPGTSSYPDFVDPKMREMWAGFFNNYLAPGDESMLAQVLPWYKEDGHPENLYTWNDMNEPSVFNGPEVSMPRDALHLGGTVEHRDVHNLYGLYVHRATYEGHLARNSNRRPFVLSRSFFIGTHRTAAIWTGDNTAQWDHLAASVPMCLSMALGGISFIGADVGGFFKHPDEELIVRWHQFGSLSYPFYRSHAHIETPRREPWKYSKTARNRVREAHIRRYQLLPYYYTLFHEYEQNGTMIIRPIWYDFPLDEKAHDSDVLDTQIVVGRNLLVRVVEKPAREMSSVSVHLPEVGWYDWHSHQYFAPGTHTLTLSEEHVPTFGRSGAIIPLKKRLRRSASAMKRDPFTLQVFLNSEGEAEGSLYVDDYNSFAYQQGHFVKVALKYADSVLSGVSTVPGNAPDWGQGLEVERIIVTGVPAVPVKVVNRESELSFISHVIPNSPELFEVVVKLPQINIREDFEVFFTHEPKLQ